MPKEYDGLDRPVLINAGIYYLCTMPLLAQTIAFSH